MTPSGPSLTEPDVNAAKPENPAVIAKMNG